MARRPVPSVDDDLAGVVSFLQKKGVIPADPTANLLENAKLIHRATHSLILWRFRLRRLPDHGKVFIEEIASDALQILPQALMGYSKTTKLLTRGIVENCLRHIYFSDHPIEFARMNREQKWYVQTEDLFAYPLTHPSFMAVESKFDAVNKLKSLYAELSAGIHGRTVRDLEMRRALNRITYSDTAVKREREFVERCAESVNFVLGVFHVAQMRHFQAEDRRIILRTMAIRARQVWRDVE